MKLWRTLTFTRRTLLQFRHDRRTLGFIIAMPLLMILIFGYTFAGDVKNLNVDVVNNDQDISPGTSPVFPEGFKAANETITRFDTDVLSIHNSTDRNVSRQKVDEGKAWAAIVFPHNFSQNLIRSFSSDGIQKNFRPTIEIYLDGSNPNIAGAILKSVNQAVVKTINELVKELNHTGMELPVNVTAIYAYGGGDTEFIDYFAPGVISFAIMMVTTMITIILFVNERRTGTLQRLLASPANESEIVVGYALAFAVIGITQSIIILIAAILIFNITIVGNIFLALFVVLLIAFGHQGLGILLSSWAKNELQAIQFIPLIIFPSVLLAGLFWPIESIPSYLQPLSYFIPLRYGIDAERSIMLRGWGLGEIWIQIAILIIFALLTLGGSILLLKRRE